MRTKADKVEGGRFLPYFCGSSLWMTSDGQVPSVEMEVSRHYWLSSGNNVVMYEKGIDFYSTKCNQLLL